MYIKINSNRAWAKIKRLTPVYDYHYYSDTFGICHIQKISDDINIDGIKGVKIVKRLPKEKLHESWKSSQ